MRLHIGTCGWAYPEWRQRFYAGVPQRQWLAHCARTFTGLEIDATFYRRIKPEVLSRWHQQASSPFLFTAKGHRLVTHVLRLKDAAPIVAETRANLMGLGSKLAAMLWQLPPSLKQDLLLLDAFGQALAAWPEVRHVLEFRNRTWMTEETVSVLARYRLASCVSDSPRWPLWPVAVSGLTYVRLHGRPQLYVSAYGALGLKPWAERVLGWLADGNTVHVYFDNTAAAPEDASLLLAMLRHAIGGSEKSR
jgi:uncharacterized protein YecE (DUF72 family)